MSSQQRCNEAQPLLRELWQTRAWRLFPMLLVYMSGLTLLVPHIPGIMTDYFAERRAGHELSCDDLPADAAAPDAAACRDAHSDVVLWSSWTSFFSNSLVSIVLTPLAGHWSDLHGRKPFFLIAQACACIPLTIVLLHITSGVSLLWYYVVQVFVSSLSSITACLAFLADLLSPANRAATFGLTMAVFSIAVFVGPAAGAAMSPQLAALGALGTVAACAAYTLLVLPESLSQEAKAAARHRHAHQQEQQRRQPGSNPAGPTVLLSTLRAMRILLRSPLFKRLTICMMLTGVVAEGLQDLLVQYLKLKMSFGVADVSHIFMMFGACGLLVQTLVLRTLLSWLGEQRVLVVSLAATATQQLILAAAGVKWVAFLGIGLGSLGSMSFPTISSIKSNNAQEHEQGSVQGALYGARALASGTGPLLFAVLFSLFTKTESPLPYFPGAPFVFGFALMLVALAVASTIPSTAGGSGGSIERRFARGGGSGHGSVSSSSGVGGSGTPFAKGVHPDLPSAAAASDELWPAGDEEAAGAAGLQSHPTSRPGSSLSVDFERGGVASASGNSSAAGDGGAVSERSRLLG